MPRGVSGTRESPQRDHVQAGKAGVVVPELNAEEAFIKGLIRLTGNQQKLIESQPVFAALDAVFTSVREQTEYR